MDNGTTEMDRLREERDAAREQLAAWFDLANKTEDHVTPVLMDGLRAYLKTSKNGGMPSDLADTVYAVMEDYCRLYVGRALVPVLRGIAAANQN